MEHLKKYVKWDGNIDWPAVLEAIPYETFFRPEDLPGKPHQNSKFASRSLWNGPLDRVGGTMYWKGRPTPSGRSKPLVEDVVQAMWGGAGVGYAAASAATFWGLSCADPYPVQITSFRSGNAPMGATFIRRTSRFRRTLNWDETSLLEALRVNPSADEFPRLVARVADAVNAGEVRLEALPFAAQSEQEYVKHLIRRLSDALSAPVDRDTHARWHQWFSDDVTRAADHADAIEQRTLTLEATRESLRHTCTPAGPGRMTVSPEYGAAADVARQSRLIHLPRAERARDFATLRLARLTAQRSGPTPSA